MSAPLAVAALRLKLLGRKETHPMTTTTYAACPQCLKLNRLDTARVLEGAQKAKCGSCGAAIDLYGGATPVTAKQLEALIAASPLPVVVDFWAPWCGPCVAFAPTYAKAAQELAGQAVFVKLDTEQEPQAAAAQGIRGIPTLAVFRGGREVKRQSGA